MIFQLECVNLYLLAQRKLVKNTMRIQTEHEVLRELSRLARDRDALPSAVGDIARLLSHPSEKVKAKALWLLGETGMRHPSLIAPHIPEIARFLDSDSALLRERAQNALGRTGRGDHLLVEPYLADMRRHAADGEPTVRLAFIWACENIATNAPELFMDDMALFASLLEDENDRVRMEAPEIFRVLGKRIPERVLPYRETLLALSENDENSVVRIHAMGAVRAIDKGIETCK